MHAIVLQAVVGLLIGSAPCRLAARPLRCSTPICSDRPRGSLGGRVPPPEPYDEGDYDAALADLQRAAARLKEAERRKLSRTPPSPRTRPRGAKTTLSRSDAGTLLLTVPASGFTSGALVGGAFTAAWFSAIVPATASMLATGGVSTLFMLPFWVAGGAVAKQTLYDPAKATTLSIGEFAWELEQRVAGVSVSSDAGSTDECDGACVEVAAYVNGVPTHVLRLQCGVNVFGLGGGLPLAELEWIAEEVNSHLCRLRDQQTNGS